MKDEVVHHIWAYDVPRTDCGAVGVANESWSQVTCTRCREVVTDAPRRLAVGDTAILTRPYAGLAQGAVVVIGALAICVGGELTAHNVHTTGGAVLPAEYVVRRPGVGEGFVERINQGDRDCEVIRVDGAKYTYEYVMPGGRIYRRTVNLARRRHQ